MDFSNILMTPLFLIFGILVTVLFHDLALDWYREYLFSLRSNLFESICDRNTAIFETTAYRSLEQKINGAIHFAEMLRPSIFLVLLVSYRRGVARQLIYYQNEAEKDFQRDLKKIETEEGSKLLQNASEKLEKSLGLYIVFSSWIMMMVSLVLVIFLSIALGFSSLISLISKTAEAQFKKTRESFERKWKNGLRLIEASAGSYSIGAR